MEENKFRDIIDRYLKGMASPSEIRAVESFFESYRKEGKAWPQELMGDAYESEKRILQGITEKYAATTKRRHHFLNTAWKVAATLLVLIGVGYAAYVFEFGHTPQAVVSALPAGGDKAILRLADGTEIPLDSTGGIAIPNQGSVSITNQNGELSYAVYQRPEEILYNTITTPRGGQYQVALADGTKVWLNAVSSLRYPTAFTGEERVVELTGEAYFEVARNSEMPFKVRISPVVPGMEAAEVLVLGTHFNVMAYPEETAIATTLIEGSVQVKKGEVKGVLKPGEQARLSDKGTLQIIPDFDVDQAIAWKNGKFVFNDTSLERIMRQLSRWYDVEVTFQDDVASLQFGGVVSRRENAPAVLGLLELTGEVEFEVDGRNIIVKKKDKLIQ